MVSASASQAEEDSSILFIRSKRARNEKFLRMVNIKYYFNEMV